MWLLLTCFSLLLSRLSPYCGIPFKSPLSFQMQLTLRVVFLRRLQRKTTQSVGCSSATETKYQRYFLFNTLKAIKETNHVFEKPLWKCSRSFLQKYRVDQKIFRILETTQTGVTGVRHTSNGQHTLLGNLPAENNPRLRICQKEHCQLKLQL